MTVTHQVKASDVRHVRATYRAQALCTGINDAGCSFRPFAAGDDREVRRQAREHVQRTPGHEVVVTVADVARYYLPEALVATLTGATPAVDGDDRPTRPTNSQED